MSWLSSYVKDQLKYHFTNLTGVKISTSFRNTRWGDRFYIDSRAGLLIFKPKNLDETIRFRNKWINLFSTLQEKEKKDHKSVEWDIYNAYDQILSFEKIEYTANLNQRLKLKKWKLKNFI